MSKLSSNGLKAESEVIRILRVDGDKLTKGTKEQDIKLDIDATHPTLGNVSIKSQSSRFTNFAVEVDQEDSVTGDRMDGWFYTSKADTYALAIRDETNSGKIDTVYIIDTAKLKDAINLGVGREVKSYNAQKNNWRYGHKLRKYDLPVVRLISLEAMKATGIITRTFGKK